MQCDMIPMSRGVHFVSENHGRNGQLRWRSGRPPADPIAVVSFPQLFAVVVTCPVALKMAGSRQCSKPSTTRRIPRLKLVERGSLCETSIES
jgi:hypothetical protein